MKQWEILDWFLEELPANYNQLVLRWGSGELTFTEWPNWRAERDSRVERKNIDLEVNVPPKPFKLFTDALTQNIHFCGIFNRLSKRDPTEIENAWN